MNGLNFTIPQRLFFIRATVTLGLIISFFLSLNLWGGQRYFPSQPVFEAFILQPPFDFVLVGLSIVFLICSLVFYTTRTFIFLALLVNIFLILFDIHRLQPWFYVYNTVLFLMMFYNGRIDNPEKFTSIFILLQLIFCSVYVFVGINQLKNSLFLETDYLEIISPLNNFLSERQFMFFRKAGIVVPWLLIFTGIGFLVAYVRYLAVSSAILLHAFLLFLLFPSYSNNPALWLMNLIFAICILFLFSGNTRQRYFSPTVLFSQPLFYFVLIVFCILPGIGNFNTLPAAMSYKFGCGKSGNELIVISEADYRKLPLYSRAFCTQTLNGYSLDLGSWCRIELNSEYFGNSLSTQPEVASYGETTATQKDLSFLAH